MIANPKVFMKSTHKINSWLDTWGLINSSRRNCIRTADDVVKMINCWWYVTYATQTANNATMFW